MFASFDSKRARGDWLFPPASQKHKIVDTDINMEGKKRKRQKAHNESDWKVDFITHDLEITCCLKDNHKNIM